MKILSIESSCDETAAAVVEDGRRVLSSVVHTQIETHRQFGGVVPEIASRQHTEQIVTVTAAALEGAALALEDLDAVAVTAAPGLIGALLVGVNFAKGLCLAAEKPLIPVHHIRGHVASNYIAHPDLRPPFLCLIVSGGHSHIVEVVDYTVFRVLGRTRDDAAGEAFDKVARVLGLPYPGGVHIDAAAEKGDAALYKLPRPKAEGPYDFSFSGLKTAVINTVHNAQQKGGAEEALDINGMAASFRYTVCDILTSRFFAAAADKDYKTLACAGGVCANALLRRMLEERAGAADATLYIPPVNLCGDNAAMIGAQAFYEYMAGHVGDLSLNAAAGMGIERGF
ncbi:MAG: tRNA (adenosine(37)-N6)-threonylcarbamoyltransferase complex transferase subunit TsaD [Oscillospiraceae bacterium]|nr:tRNA (adenosine(37)-N6)-threonylcarbamoyltransferase complex transferase subunit TsaD [Oscillospiraceae bacterium]